MSSVMKVCLNTCWFSFDVIGGGEHQFLNTHKALLSAGLKCELFNQWRPEFDSFDIMHFFTVQQGMASFCEYVKNRGMPLALSSIFWPRGDASRGEMWEIEKILRLADVIFPNSGAERDIIASKFDLDPNKFITTVNAIDPADFSERDPESFRSQHDLNGEFILCVGNIEPRKNQLRLLEALQMSGIKQPLVCIGNIRDGGYFKMCQEFDQFKYVGALPQAKLASAYMACTLFALPSTCETPGLAALEAGYFGSNILITEVGSTRDYFSEFATYIQPADTANIAAGLTEALSNPPSEQRKLLLKKRIADNYTWQQTAQQIIGGYERILKEF